MSLMTTKMVSKRKCTENTYLSSCWSCSSFKPVLVETRNEDEVMPTGVSAKGSTAAIGGSPSFAAADEAWAAVDTSATNAGDKGSGAKSSARLLREAVKEGIPEIFKKSQIFHRYYNDNKALCVLEHNFQVYVKGHDSC